jgi:hypothetical protein
MQYKQSPNLQKIIEKYPDRHERRINDLYKRFCKMLKTPSNHPPPKQGKAAMQEVSLPYPIINERWDIIKGV